MVAHCSEIISEAETVSRVMRDNARTSAEFTKRQTARDRLICPTEALGGHPLVLANSTDGFTVNPNPRMRPAILHHLQKKGMIERYNAHLLLEKYNELDHKWQAYASKLESKSNLTAIPLSKNSIDVQRGSRRAGNVRNDGVVRSEAEWENAMMMLGLASDDHDIRIRERAVPDPPMLTTRPRYTNNNNLVIDPIGDLADYNSTLDHTWSDSDRSIFRKTITVYDKDFFKIAPLVPLKSTRDCVRYYYREKINERFKQLILRNYSGRGRRRKILEREEIEPEFQTFEVSNDESVFIPRQIQKSTEELEADCEFYQAQYPIEDVSRYAVSDINLGDYVGWNSDEVSRALRGFELFGHRDLATISSMLPNKSEDQCREFYAIYRKRMEVSANSGNVTNLGIHLKKGITGTGSKRGPKPKRNTNDIVQVSLDLKADGDLVVSELDIIKKRKLKDEDSEKKIKKKKKHDIDAPIGATLNAQSPTVTDMDGADISGQDASRKTISYWSVQERSDFLRLLAENGRGWESISKALGTKSVIQVRNYFHNSRAKLGLDNILRENGHPLSAAAAKTMVTTDSPKKFLKFLKPTMPENSAIDLSAQPMSAGGILLPPLILPNSIAAAAAASSVATIRKSAIPLNSKIVIALNRLMKPTIPPFSHLLPGEELNSLAQNIKAKLGTTVSALPSLIALTTKEPKKKVLLVPTFNSASVPKSHDKGKNQSASASKPGSFVVLAKKSLPVVATNLSPDLPIVSFTDTSLEQKKKEDGHEPN